MVACTCASTKLDNVFENFQNGSITVNELEKIDAHFEQMKRLYDAMAKTHQDAGYGELQSVLMQRHTEFQMFSDTLDCLRHIFRTLDSSICGESKPF